MLMRNLRIAEVTSAEYVNQKVRRRSLAPNRYAALRVLSLRGFGK